MPTADTAAAATRGTLALVDRSLGPCWSWAGHRAPWAGKHRTPGHTFLKGFHGRACTTLVKKPPHRDLYQREKDDNTWLPGLRTSRTRHRQPQDLAHPPDHRRPLATYPDSFWATIGRYPITATETSSE